MKNSEYYDLLVEEIIADLTANLRLKQFTKNSALIGAFAEESVNELIHNVVSPLRVSTGSVISRYLLEGEKELPQIDCIIWNPSPLPALFSKGNFGLIPFANSLGIIEIKSSNYSGVGKKIESVLLRENELVDEAPPNATRSQGKIKLIPDKEPKSLGVICLYDSSKVDNKLTELIESKKVSVILEHTGDFELKPSRIGILNLISFLGKIRKRAILSDGNKNIAVDMINET